MAVSEEYGDYLLDRLSLFAPVVMRKMFGGLGFFHNKLMFALAADNVLYFKVDDNNRQDYIEAGMNPFRPYKDKPFNMGYFEVPADVIEDDKQLCRWAAGAYQAAENKARSGRPRRSKK